MVEEGRRLKIVTKHWSTLRSLSLFLLSKTCDFMVIPVGSAVCVRQGAYFLNRAADLLIE
jgi:hypothetical protein